MNLDPIWSGVVERVVSSGVAWIGAAITTIIVAHSLHAVLNWVDKRFTGPNHLIALIELLMLLIMAVVVLHEFLHPKTSEGAHGSGFLETPQFLVVMMAAYALASMVLYLLHRRLESRTRR